MMEIEQQSWTIVMLTPKSRREYRIR